MQQIKEVKLVRYTAVGLLFVIAIQLVSCMPVMMMIYGIHQPRYVSDAAVINYHHGLGLQEEIYRLKNYNEKNRNQFQYVGNAMPDMLLFNSKGQLTKFDIDCSSNFHSIAEFSLEAIDSMDIAEKALKDFMGDTYVINNETNADPPIDQIPLYVIVFAEYAGRLNKESVPELVEKLKGREDVQYVLLNVDYSVGK